MYHSVVIPIKGGSCTAEEEFEFTTRVQLKATADFHSCSRRPSFLLFVYVCKWVVGKKPLLITIPVVAATANSHSSGGPELKLRWWTQTLPQLEKNHNKRPKQGKIQDFPEEVPTSKCSTNLLLPPSNVVCEGYVFTCVCQSFCSQGGSASVHAEIPPPEQTPQEQTPPKSRPLRSRHPPRADIPSEQTPPRSRHPPGADTPLSADTPQSRHPPWSRHPPRADIPLGADTPRADTPREQTPSPWRRACWEIRSTRGRYASYWNAILFG